MDRVKKWHPMCFASATGNSLVAHLLQQVFADSSGNCPAGSSFAPLVVASAGEMDILGIFKFQCISV